MVRTIAWCTLLAMACGARSTPTGGKSEPDRFQREIAAMMTGKRGDPEQPADLMVGDTVRAKQKGLWTRSRVTAVNGELYDIVFENGEPQSGLKRGALQRDQADVGTFECATEASPDLAAFCTSDCDAIKHADLRAYCSGSCDAITSTNYREICKVRAQVAASASRDVKYCENIPKGQHKLACFQMAREAVKVAEDRAASSGGGSYSGGGGGGGGAAPSGPTCKANGEMSDSPTGGDCCSGKVRPVSRGEGLQPDYACCEFGTPDCS